MHGAAKVSESKRNSDSTPVDRKGAIAKATWRVVAARGLEGASLRAIAREAGFTTGVLMHYFQDKEELFLFAVDRMFELMEGELIEALQQENPILGLKRFFFDFLASTRESEILARSWLNFVGRALWNKGALRNYRRHYTRLRRLIREVMQAASRAGVLRRDIDLENEADAVFALFDGTTMHALLEPGRFPPERQILLVEHYLWHLLESKDLDSCP